MRRDRYCWALVDGIEVIYDRPNPSQKPVFHCWSTEHSYKILKQYQHMKWLGCQKISPPSPFDIIPNVLHFQLSDLDTSLWNYSVDKPVRMIPTSFGIHTLVWAIIYVQLTGWRWDHLVHYKHSQLEYRFSSTCNVLGALDYEAAFLPFLLGRNALLKDAFFDEACVPYFGAT